MERPDEAFHLTGDRLGKFVILSELGRGSMGVVYEALQEDLKRKVALKILPANITLDAKQVRRFRREAESVARLRHDNVIQIYEVGQVGTTHYFAMELVDGRPLEPGLLRDRQSILEAARIARDAARGLAHAHERGVIHRDIKPGNLLVDRTGRVVVTDFGLARLTDSASLTSTDAIVGTPKYMSPEQILARADRPVDGRADVYALGATLYHATAGRPPFEAPTVQGFIKAILEERPPSPRRFNRQIPFDLATIVLRCLEKDPAHRYASAAELADDLDRFLSGQRIRAKPKGAFALGAEAIRRHRVIAALAAVAALATGLTLVLGGRAAEESRRAQEESARAEWERTLREIGSSEDLDAAIVEIEAFAERHPDDPLVASLRARLRRDRALKVLKSLDPDFQAALEDLERADLQGSFWHLAALLETDRLAEARAAAEGLAEGSPLRRLTLARIAEREGRHADALALLAEPVRDPEHPEAAVLASLTRGLAHRGLGRQAEAVADLTAASSESTGLASAWLHARALSAFQQVGGDARDLLTTILSRTVSESMRALERLRERISGEEYGFFQRFRDAVLRIARQPSAPPTALESAALDRLAATTGEERAATLLQLAAARLFLGRVDLALESLDRAEEESTAALDPYLHWGRALAMRVKGEDVGALDAIRQAIELALAAGGAFPDLQPLCEHAALLAERAPAAEAERTSEFLRERLAPDLGPWVSALLAGLSAARDPER